MKSGSIILAAFLLAILITYSAGVTAVNGSYNSTTGRIGFLASYDDANAGQRIRTRYVLVNPESYATRPISYATGIQGQQNYIKRERARVDNQIYGASTGEIPPSIAKVRDNYLIHKQNYLTATDKYLLAKKVYATTSSSIQDYKERLKAADSGEKKEIMGEFRFEAKNYLISQSSVLAGHLAALKEKYGLNGEISSAMEFYSKEKLRIKDGNLSDLELKKASTDMRVHWSSTYRQVRLNYAKSLGNKINLITKKGHIFSGRFGEIIQDLNESETKSKMERGLEIFNEDLNKFEIVYGDLKQGYADADSDEETDELLRKGKRLLKEMNQRLMKDFHMLKRMFYHYKKIQAGEDVDSTVLDELLEQMEMDSSLDIAISEEIQN